tara:strand:+ start:1289 stop:1492 length:204 start_codon:yes stop_codon:yes gene_type:complete
MIRFTNIKGQQSIQEICDNCKTVIKGLSISDITVNKTENVKIYDESGKEIKRTEARPKIYCDDCKDD